MEAERSRPPALELIGVEKSFGGAPALRGVTLGVRTASITGIVGENGAGKSTLMRVAYGLVQPEAGEVRVDGAPVRITRPSDALAHGIGMVHQHFMLVEPFTVLENVLLGREGGLALRGRLGAARAKLARLASDHGLPIDPDAIVADLSVGQRQRVEILKALYRDARVLILDEPTAVLSPIETEALFRVLRSLAAGGASIILITHKLREVMSLTDEIAVMRAGRVVGTRRTRETDAKELADLMIGRRLRASSGRSGRPTGPVLLSAEGLATSREVALRGADLALCSGEVVGVAGVSGNGQGALLHALAGLVAPSGGRIRIGARVVTADDPASPAEMRALGVAHVPEDRLRDGMAAALPADDNAILGRQRDRRFAPGGRLDRGAIARHCAALMTRFDVRPATPRLPAAGLSGGNQQKLVLGREVEGGPAILLVGQPTRGVDIGAVAAIHAELRALRDAGCAILLVSADLDEVLALSDRILVMVDGRIVGEVEAGAADERRLGLMMAGAGEPAERAA